MANPTVLWPATGEDGVMPSSGPSMLSQLGLELAHRKNDSAKDRDVRPSPSGHTGLEGPSLWKSFSVTRVPAGHQGVGSKVVTLGRWLWGTGLGAAVRINGRARSL